VGLTCCSKLGARADPSCLTEFEFEPQQPSFFVPSFTVRPGRAFLDNWTLEALGGGSDTSEGQGWWARIYTTSRNVVPSIHFYGPGLPDRYVSVGDMAVFELPTGFVPPTIGPVERPPRMGSAKAAPCLPAR
jgi:hypothetical protein